MPKGKTRTKAVEIEGAKTARGPRVLTSLMGPKDLDSPEKRQEYVDDLVDELVELVREERKRQGLPPLLP